MMIQLDELEFPSKILKTFKFRTEIVPLSTNPLFSKNTFNFFKISFGSRITLKLGCFSTELYSDPPENEILLVIKNNILK